MKGGPLCLLYWQVELRGQCAVRGILMGGGHWLPDRVITNHSPIMTVVHLSISGRWACRMTGTMLSAHYEQATNNTQHHAHWIDHHPHHWVLVQLALAVVVVLVWGVAIPHTTQSPLLCWLAPNVIIRMQVCLPLLISVKFELWNATDCCQHFWWALRLFCVCFAVMRTVCLWIEQNNRIYSVTKEYSQW